MTRTFTSRTFMEKINIFDENVFISVEDLMLEYIESDEENQSLIQDIINILSEYPISYTVECICILGTISCTYNRYYNGHDNNARVKTLLDHLRPYFGLTPRYIQILDFYETIFAMIRDYDNQLKHIWCDYTTKRKHVFDKFLQYSDEGKECAKISNMIKLCRKEKYPIINKKDIPFHCTHAGVLAPNDCIEMLLINHDFNDEFQIYHAWLDDKIHKTDNKYNILEALVSYFAQNNIPKLLSDITTAYHTVLESSNENVIIEYTRIYLECLYKAYSINIDLDRLTSRLSENIERLSDECVTEILLHNVFDFNTDIIEYLYKEKYFTRLNTILVCVTTNIEYFYDIYKDIYPIDSISAASHNISGTIYTDKFKSIYKNLGMNYKDAFQPPELLHIIQHDKVEEFVIYITEHNVDLAMKMRPYIYYYVALKNYDNYSLIALSAYLGAFQIFKYLHSRGQTIQPYIAQLAIRGDNPELIHYIEERLTHRPFGFSTHGIEDGGKTPDINDDPVCIYEYNENALEYAITHFKNNIAKYLFTNFIEPHSDECGYKRCVKSLAEKAKCHKNYSMMKYFIDFIPKQ